MLPKQTRPGAPKVKALASLTDRIQVIRKNQLSHSSSDQWQARQGYRATRKLLRRGLQASCQVFSSSAVETDGEAGGTEHLETRLQRSKIITRSG